MFETTRQQLLARLAKHPELAERVQRLRSKRGVGEVTALTWALEIGEPERFSSGAHAISYCGLTAALVSSADKQQRGPISRQRNAHLQTVLIEAAKLAPRTRSWPPSTNGKRVAETAIGRRWRWLASWWHIYWRWTKPESRSNPGFRHANTRRCIPPHKIPHRAAPSAPLSLLRPL
jgi:transposase